MEKNELFSVIFHDKNGIYEDGEIDITINKNLTKYIEKYGYKGVSQIISVLDNLAFEVRKRLCSVFNLEIKDDN